MSEFKSLDDIEHWLEPMSYARFWVAVAPYGVDGELRTHCDGQIDAGANPGDVLDVMKWRFAAELAEALGLKRKLPTPWIRLVVDHEVH